jgi:hypothetical protein
LLFRTDKLKFKENYSIVIGLNDAHRFCVWLVALAGTKLTKENEPEEIQLGIS